MGQAVSSCAPCCSANEDVESSWETYQKSVPNDKNPQWKEKVKTIDDKVVLAVDPKSTEEERAAERMQILMNLSTETWKEWKIKYIPYYFNIFINFYFNCWSRNEVLIIEEIYLNKNIM